MLSMEARGGCCDGEGTFHSERGHLLGPEGRHEIRDRLLGGRVREPVQDRHRCGPRRRGRDAQWRDPERRHDESASRDGGRAEGALELEAIIRSAEEMRRPLKLSDVRLEDYDAVYLPGGHGPMADLAFDADAGRLLTAQLASGRPLFIVCHGPAAMLSTRIRGVSPFKGYRVTCFTNEEEEAVGLASKATWLLETELKEKIGVAFSRGEIWKPYMVEDRNLVTGQNPHSAAILGRRLLEVLAGHGASAEQPQLRVEHSSAMSATV